MTHNSTESSCAIDRRSFCASATAAVGALLLHDSAAAATSDDPIAKTLQGRVRGYNDGPIKVFKNIPYGAPTTGSNRWLPPKPAMKWRGIRDALEPGFMAPQGSGQPIPEEAVMLQHGPLGEDCLNLNVYTPAAHRDGKRRPVMVWFHGGGFGAGSGNAKSTDGRNMAEHHDVVFVTLSHRLNVFGFLYLADLFGPTFADSGNVGMLDCVAALRWVRDNIANFGGDAGNVTIVGQSGGGMKVSCLMAMPAAAGLFHRAIIQSGGLVRATNKEQASANAKRLIDSLGVKTAAELQAKPWQDIIAAMEQARMQSGPVMDARVLPAHPFEPAAPSQSRDIPLLIGSTETEPTFFPFTPLEPIDDAKLIELVKGSTRVNDDDVAKLIQLFRSTYPGKDNTYLFQLLSSQNGFQVAIDTVASRKADQGGAAVYMYYFTKHTSVRDGKLKSPHTLDIPYVFDNLQLATSIAGPVTSGNQALANKASSLWANFARTGKPTAAGVPDWTPFDTATRATMIIDDEFKLVPDPMRATRTALAELRTRATASQMPGAPGGGGPPR